MTGDVKQSDLYKQNGLIVATAKLRNVSNIKEVRFELDDIVRSGIVGEILRAWD
jgi:phosphate starvation-inducible protein PhoH